MVIDTSVLIAILSREPEEQAFRAAIKFAPDRLLSAATHVEAAMVTLSLRGDAGVELLDALIAAFRLTIVPVTDEHAVLAIDAFRRFGRGRHPASLNYGDCFSYALAKSTGQPLLFKGSDFGLTDIKQAVPT
jgi:ribonuclease VapC